MKLDRKKSFIKKNNESTEKGNVLETICQLARLGTFFISTKSEVVLDMLGSKI